MAKFHIGLVTQDKDLESQTKEAAQQVGGAYIHLSKTIYELIQKLSMQKVQLILMDLPVAGEGSDFPAAYSFLRSKKDLQGVPICVLTDQPKFEVSFLLNDPLVRGFARGQGIFLPLLSMVPLLQENGNTEGLMTEDWIKSEFLASLLSQIGQNLAFNVREATEDERRSSFFGQCSQEVRTHLGWFKFTTRLLAAESAGISQLFQGMNQDAIEEVSQILVQKVTDDFKTKIAIEISSRGAIHLPEVERLTPAEKKWIFSNTKYNGILFDSKECQILLEMGRSL